MPDERRRQGLGRILDVNDSTMRRVGGRTRAAIVRSWCQITFQFASGVLSKKSACGDARLVEQVSRTAAACLDEGSDVVAQLGNGSSVEHRRGDGPAIRGDGLLKRRQRSSREMCVAC